MAFESKDCGCVTDGGVGGFVAFGGLCILNELERHPGSVGRLTSDGIDGVEKDADRMPTANRVPVFLQITVAKELNSQKHDIN